MGRGWSLLGTGVTSDAGTRVNSYVMVLTSMLYLIPQVQKRERERERERGAFTRVNSYVMVLTSMLYLIPQVQKREREGE